MERETPTVNFLVKFEVTVVVNMKLLLECDTVQCD